MSDLKTPMAYRMPLSVAAPQYSIKFLVPSKIATYDLSRPPGLRNRGGGMGVKYARVEEASRIHFCQRITSVDEIEPHDIVFADWLWFVASDDKVDAVKSFIELPNVKGIYGSELSILNCQSKLVKQLICLLYTSPSPRDS